MTMVEKPSIESQLPLAPGSGLAKARAHAVSERSNDHETILATVSTRDSNFVLVTPAPDGDVEFGAWLDVEAVHAFYDSALERQDTLEQYAVNELNAHWFQFAEAVGSVGWHSDGLVRQVHVAVLFPVWTDGILGEICLKAPDWAGRSFDITQRVDLSERLDAFDDGWRSGDLDATAATAANNTPPLHNALRTPHIHPHPPA